MERTFGLGWFPADTSYKTWWISEKSLFCWAVSSRSNAQGSFIIRCQRPRAIRKQQMGRQNGGSGQAALVADLPWAINHCGEWSACGHSSLLFFSIFMHLSSPSTKPGYCRWSLEFCLLTVVTILSRPRNVLSFVILGTLIAQDAKTSDRRKPRGGCVHVTSLRGCRIQNLWSWF